jgi:hypothetical protein
MRNEVWCAKECRYTVTPGFHQRNINLDIRPRGQDSDHDCGVQLQGAAPLADTLRPKTVEEVVGQDHLTTGPDALLSDARVAAENIIFWGPPG